MALSGFEIKVIAHLIARARAELGRTPRLLSLGYPDALFVPETLDALDLPFSWDALKKRDNGAEVWKSHGREDLANRGMLESREVLKSLGADVTITDAIFWGGEELDYVLDLNMPVGKDKFGQFDVIVDPGTLEHCFNIGQAFTNIDDLLAPSGYIYHHTTSILNHGFWAISPTAFFDFYQLHGYELGVPYRWGSPWDSFGIVASLRRLDPFKSLSDNSPQLLASYIFRKGEANSKLGEFPVQRCYSSLSRELELTDFFPRGVPR